MGLDDSSSTIDDHARCDHCGELIPDESELLVEVTREGPWRSVDARFCSWDHAVAWFAEGEQGKEFVDVPRFDPVAHDMRWETVTDALTACARLVGILLMVVGTWAVADHFLG